SPTDQSATNQRPAKRRRRLWALAWILLLLFLLSCCTRRNPGIDYARSIILANDEKRTDRVEPRRATELIAYRQTGIVGKSASVISNYLESMSTTLFMPIHISWKDEQSSGREALLYARAAAQSGRQVLLLYTPEMMVEELQSGIEVLPLYSSIAILARERVCFAVRADSPYTSMAEVRLDALSGQTFRVGGQSVSGGIDELRLIHLGGLPQENARYVSAGRRSALYALLDGTVDVACMPVSEAEEARAEGRIRILSCPALEDPGNCLGMNWLCLLLPGSQTDLQTEYWRQTMYAFCASLFWEKVAAEQRWVLSFMDAQQLRRFLETQRAALLPLSGADALPASAAEPRQ
ncbi:MAG: hypothetical protein Q4G52_00245, partial [Clostridia bacterium]|nr:hypothetical protein [Clostridia bacterium]